MSEDLRDIVLVLFMVTGFGLSVLYAASWFGMHENTKDGNTFRLARPFTNFEKEHFNEAGNKARIFHLKIWASSILWGGLFYWFQSGA